MTPLERFKKWVAAEGLDNAAEVARRLKTKQPTIWRLLHGETAVPEWPLARAIEAETALSPLGVIKADEWYDAKHGTEPAADAAPDPSAEPTPDTEGTNPRAKAPTADTALDADALAEPKVSAR
jgi:hypothetical protein